METYKVHFEKKTDIIFVDPSYFVKEDEVWEEYWEDFSKNKNLGKLGCSAGVCASVEDVYPNLLVDVDSGNVIGELCSDSCILGCFRLEDVLAYNPDFAEYMKEYPGSVLVIEGFEGDIVFIVEDAPYYGDVRPFTTIKGSGNVNFHSAFVDDDGKFHYKPDLFQE